MGEKHKKSEDYQKGYNQALKDINVPRKVLIEECDPSVCPRCKKDFSDYEE